MATITVSLQPGEYTSFSGVQFSDNYLDKAIRIYEYAQSAGRSEISSKSIQKALLIKYSFQESDLRTLISLLKKMGYIESLDNKVTADKLFTLSGKLFIQICKVKSLDTKNNLAFTNRIERAFQLILQKGLLYAWNNKETSDVPKSFWLLVELFKILGYMSGKEYLYAISCKKDPSYIAQLIRENRQKNNDYNIINSITQKTIANTAYSYNFGILQQAGLLEFLSSIYFKLTKNIFI